MIKMSNEFIIEEMKESIYGTELFKLHCGLSVLNIPHIIRKRFNGYQLRSPLNSNGRWDWDVICLPGSCGCETGLLEAAGEIVTKKEQVAGYLSAEDVLIRILKFKEGEKI